MSQTALRSAGVAQLVEAIKRRQQLAPDKTTPFFFQIGDSFTIGEDAWSGPAIASRDAIYLLRQTKTRDALPMPGLSSDANLRMCPQEMHSLDYAEIPSAITSDPHWMAIVKNPSPVTVLLRDQATSTSLVPFTADIEFLSAYPAIRVRCGNISPANAEAILRTSGWLPPRPGSQAPAPVGKRTNWTPIIVGLCVLLFIAITVAVIQSESLSVLASLALCLPMLGGMLAFLAWYLRPAAHTEGD